MQQDDQEQNCTLEHYLRTLRKKVEHHIKNPFEIPFANYSFEQLYNWKNNILQLDATSLLYGQRVDFLHSGTLHILENIVKNGDEAKAESKAEQSGHSIREKMIHEGSPFERHLEPSSRIDGLQDTQQKNLVLWRQIMKKRDTLPLLMLNQLPLTHNLRLELCHTDNQNYYESLLLDDGSFYAKIIDFNLVNANQLQIFSTVENFIQELNYDLISLKKIQKPRGVQSNFFEDIINFDFTLSHYHQHVDNAEKLDFRTDEPIDKRQLFIDIVPQPQEFQQEQSMSQASNFSLFTIKTTSSMSKKPRKKAEGKKKTKKLQQSYVDFRGFNPTRNEVFQYINDDDETDRYLTPKDHLHLKFMKYNHPFRKVKKGHVPQRIAGAGQQSFEKVESQFYGHIQSDINQQVGYSTCLNVTKQAEKIKQAVLPIKQMKKRIRDVMCGHSRYKLADLKKQFSLEDPLDIFIATLHIAAEDSVLLTI